MEDFSYWSHLDSWEDAIIFGLFFAWMTLHKDGKAALLSSAELMNFKYVFYHGMRALLLKKPA